MCRNLLLLVWVLAWSITASAGDSAVDAIHRTDSNDKQRDREHRDQQHRYFEQVKAVVFADAYEELPQYKVTRTLFDDNGNNALLADALRTLESKDDFIDFPAGQKLLQANGICFAGRWNINNASPFSGLLAANTELPLIARASVSLSGTRQKHKRAFGLALKVFPDTADGEHVVTRNLFVMHTLGGVITDSVYSLTLDNEPELGSLPPFSQWLTAHRLERDLKQADKQVSKAKPNARFRPVSHLAAIDHQGQTVAEPVKPYWLQLRPEKTLTLKNHDDFRHELNVKNYPNNSLSWTLYAAEHQPKGKAHAQWQQIGEIVFSESIVSQSCDTKLHFSHPTVSGNPYTLNQ